jgi:hypothetical protein
MSYRASVPLPASVSALTACGASVLRELSGDANFKGVVLVETPGETYKDMKDALLALARKYLDNNIKGFGVAVVLQNGQIFAKYGDACAVCIGVFLLTSEHFVSARRTTAEETATIRTIIDDYQPIVALFL